MNQRSAQYFMPGSSFMPAVVMDSTHHETQRIHADPSRLRVTHGEVPPSNSIEIEKLSDADALLRRTAGNLNVC